VTGPEIAELVARIHADGSTRGVLYLTGGGSEVLPMLLARGGGSNTLLSARIPYAPEDFRATLGGDLGRLVDARAARGLAMAALRHALAIRGGIAPSRLFGIGATSKLAKAGTERAERTHEIHAALQTSRRTLLRSLALPGDMNRPWEERITALIILDLVARAKGLEPADRFVHGDWMLRADSITDTFADAETCRHPELPLLFEGERSWVAYDLAGETFGPASPDADAPRLLLPGSFRPLHDGHASMAEVASRIVGSPCAYELSLFHPEKPPLDYVAIASRLAGFRGRAGRLYLSNAPTYVEKARVFPGCVFAVGLDTALRIVDPRFYPGIAGRDAALAEFAALEGRLLVFGRVDAAGRFLELDPDAFETGVASFFRSVATPVPEALFRLDVSSTEVRQRSGIDPA
jgi:hypothetical protein